MHGVAHTDHRSVPGNPLASEAEIESRSQTLALALLFAMAVSASGGVILLALRLPAGDSVFSIGPLHVLRGFGLMLVFALSLALMLERRSPPWSIALVPIGLLVLLVQGGVMAGSLADIALALVLSALLVRARQRHVLPHKHFAAMLLLGFTVAGVGMAAMVLKGYAHPLAFENALLSRQFRDTLFHAAIAGSLQHSHIASIGLDGAVGLSYHTLSHRLIGAFATWSGLPDLMAYSLFVPVIGVPVLTFLILASPAASQRSTGPATDPFIGAAVMVALVLLLNTAALMSIWFSESFVIGLWLLMLALFVMASCKPGKVNVATGLGLALLVFLASQAKISVGAILASGICTWLFLSAGMRGLFMAALFGAAPFLFVYFSNYASAVANGGSMLGPFYFYTRFPEVLVAMIVIARVIYRFHRTDMKEGSNTLILRLAIAAMLASGFLCGLLLKLPGSAEGYFVSPALWAALLYIGYEGRLAGWSPRVGWASPRAFAVMAALLATLLAVMVLVKAKPQRLPVAYLRSIEMLAQASGGEGTQGLLRSTVFGQVVEQIQADPTIDAVQVDPRVRQIWDGQDLCWTVSLVIPATTRRPMLEGLPPAADRCELPLTYGFADYRPDVSSARILDDAAVCERAAALSLKRILRVGPEGMTTLNCAIRTPLR